MQESAANIHIAVNNIQQGIKFSGAEIKTSGLTRVLFHDVIARSRKGSRPRDLYLEL